MTAYTQQIDQKIQYLQQLFQGLDVPEIQVFESPEQHYRMRAEFRIWHEGGEMFYAMFERGQKASGASLILLIRARLPMPFVRNWPTTARFAATT